VDRLHELVQTTGDGRPHGRDDNGSREVASSALLPLLGDLEGLGGLVRRA
jgi:hypothetical protein